jgi:hypothetical protein
VLGIGTAATKSGATNRAQHLSGCQRLRRATQQAQDSPLDGRMALGRMARSALTCAWPVY